MFLAVAEFLFLIGVVPIRTVPRGASDCAGNARPRGLFNYFDQSERSKCPPTQQIHSLSPFLLALRYRFPLFESLFFRPEIHRFSDFKSLKFRELAVSYRDFLLEIWIEFGIF